MTLRSDDLGSISTGIHGAPSRRGYQRRDSQCSGKARGRALNRASAIDGIRGNSLSRNNKRNGPRHASRIAHHASCNLMLRVKHARCRTTRHINASADAAITQRKTPPKRTDNHASVLVRANFTFPFSPTLTAPYIRDRSCIGYTSASIGPSATRGAAKRAWVHRRKSSLHGRRRERPQPRRV